LCDLHQEGLTVAVDVERLQQGAQVRFPGRPEVVSLIAVRPGPFWEFYFDGPSGPGKHVLAEAELAGVEVIEAPGGLRFDGDPGQFRLGVEARRIDIAFAYEMAGVAVSNIQPLPHQLEAVGQAASLARVRGHPCMVRAVTRQIPGPVGLRRRVRPTVVRERIRRARCVPDRPVNSGNLRSLADSSRRHLTSE
jgi:hypothetical protein